ncbi:head GIN domain-containing protein [Kordiimonas aquimaris]|uniref:head GIN domain-containing protein n=1 Tax=Kordiimonas aquimaris TaxID=707591 RepID=UPI0021CED094|nr:head GIN domain-containing protein [Kordiimonas aquimaris]
MNSLGKFVAGACVVTLAGISGAIAADTSEEMRDIEAFNQIKNKGSFEVNVTVGGEQSVKITADSDIMGDIETEVRGDTLHIELDNERKWRRNHRIDVLRVDITVPSLEAAMVYGSGDFTITGLSGGNFKTSVHGAGDVELIDATVDDLSIDIKGSGDVEASGTCNSLDVEVKGSGDVSARKMECATGDVGIMGSGDVAVHLKEKADVGIMGSGDVDVWGKPESVKSRSMGSGDVTLR